MSAASPWVWRLTADNTSVQIESHVGTATTFEAACVDEHGHRARDHRIYFERRPEGVTVHRVVHKNTLQDFLFRSKLSSAEDEQLSKKDGFWELIEAGAKAGKAK